MIEEMDLRFVEKDFKFDLRAAGIVLNPETKEVLIGVKEGNETKQVMFGGAVKKFEKSDQAVIREIKEELGIDTEVIRLLGVIEHSYTLSIEQSTHQQIVFMYLLDAQDYTIQKVEEFSTTKPVWIHYSEVQYIYPVEANVLIQNYFKQLNQ